MSWVDALAATQQEQEQSQQQVNEDGLNEMKIIEEREEMSYMHRAMTSWLGMPSPLSLQQQSDDSSLESDSAAPTSVGDGDGDGSDRDELVVFQEVYAVIVDASYL
jgi:hypothetical protein